MKAFIVKNVVFHEEPEPAEPVIIPLSEIVPISFRMQWTRKGKKELYRLFFRKTPMKLRRRKPKIWLS